MKRGPILVASKTMQASLRVAAQRLSQTTAELRWSTSRLAALVAMNLDLASLHDPARMMDSLSNAARELIGAPCLIVALRHEDDDAVRQVSVRGLELNAAARVRASILRCDPFPRPAQQSVQLPIEPSPEWPEGLPTAGSMSLVPIRSPARSYGWICALTERSDRAFSDEDEHLLSTLGLLAGRIYEDRSLYLDTQRQAAELARQIEEKREAQRRLDIQYAVARILAETSSLDEAAPALLAAICHHLDFAFGILRDIDRRDQVMRSSTIWHEPDAGLAHFANGSRALVFSAESGITGRAWSTGQPVWAADCLNDSVFLRTGDAAAAGLRVAAAFPVFARGEVVGVLAFLGRTVREECPEVMDLLSALGSQIGQFIERRRQEREIARLNQLYAVLSSVNDLARHAAEPVELFSGICRIAVEKGGLGLAAIGTYDPVRSEVDLVAGAGQGIDALLAAPALPVLETPPDRRDEVAQAVLGRQPVVNGDIAATPHLGGERRRAMLRLGYRASVAKPLLVEGRPAAVLMLFSRDRDIFTGRYVDLLTEVSREISYALDHLAHRDRLAYLAHHDPLTGLPNRVLFRERFGQALLTAARAGHRVAVLFIDVRGLQRVNDTLGRPAGDALLREVARRLLGSARNPENLARIEGDRFGTFISTPAEASDVANRIEQVSHSVLQEPFVVAGQSVQLTGAVGIALTPGDGTDVDTLLRNVEAAVVNAKRLGRPYLFYEPSLNARVAETLRLQGRLKQAVAAGEFDLLYQPKVDLRFGRIQGVEALLRWSDPDRGPIPPTVFIPVLEESGLIHVVGAWVMRRALDQQRAWLAAGRRPPRVAVNVSALQFQSADFIDTTRRLIAEFSDVHAVGGGGLDIEITESMLMQDVTSNVEKLSALRDLGVTVAIDDFGTGYSSLAYLSRLPIQGLKIDRSFVNLLGHRPDDMTIVSTIISLAHALHLQVIAEGVETEEQANLLRVLRCDQMQGYLFHRPMQAAELASLLPER